MNKNCVYDWIIGIGGSDLDRVCLYKFKGSIKDAKKKLIEMIQEDKENDPESWVYGTQNTDDVKVETHKNDAGVEWCELYGYNCYSSYHIDYSAEMECGIPLA